MTLEVVQSEGKTERNSVGNERREMKMDAYKNILSSRTRYLYKMRATELYYQHEQDIKKNGVFWDIMPCGS
jgi:hypothetical protein